MPSQPIDPSTFDADPVFPLHRGAKIEVRPAVRIRDAAGLSLAQAQARHADGELVASLVARLRSQGVDGAVVLNEATELVRDAPPADLHLVVVDSPPDERFSIVQTDHAGGARAAVEHLLALGHDTVHHIAGPARSFAAAERERGWRAALVDAGLAVPEPTRGDWTSASGHAAVSALTDATAVFVANDQMALGALRAFADAGRRVPEDVAVVGFDDIVDAAQYRPPLTTVRQDFDALGARAVRALVAAIEGGVPVAETVPATLVVRSSAR